jgi:hypothetical protein
MRQVALMTGETVFLAGLASGLLAILQASGVRGRHLLHIKVADPWF